MAARVFIISILFTEVLIRPAASLAGTKEASSGGVVSLSGSKCENLELERIGELCVKLDTESSGNVVVERRGTVLKCSSKCLAPRARQNVLWYRNGSLAPSCGSVRCVATNKGELRFRMREKHGTQGSKFNNENEKAQSPELYRCVVKNNLGSIRSSPTNLEIPYFSNGFKKSPQDVVVREGEVARLSCFIDSIPSPPNITWQHKKKPLSFEDKTKYFMVSPGVLYINATKLSDAGSYRCVATNKYLKKTQKSKEARMQVDSKTDRKNSDVLISLLPQISYNYQLILGSNLTLICASSGFPSLVIWTFNSSASVYSTASSRRMDVHTTRQPRPLINSTNSIVVLNLKNITIEDEGDYQCSVQSFGRTLQTQIVALEVLILPTFTVKPDNAVKCSGSTVRCECQARGHPVPRIYWLKDSQPLELNPRRKIYNKENNKIELVISSTIPEDSGIYQCVAVNTAGEIWAAAVVQIVLLPRSPPPPVSLKCRAASPDKILLTWETPQNVQSAHNIESWITVHYAKMEPGSREDTSLTDNSTYVGVGSLEPFTNYSMYVRKWIREAASNQSHTVQCTTAASGMGTNADSVPTAAPAIVLNPISNARLNVSWLPLNKKEARGYITEYKLQWRLKEQRWIRVRNFSSIVHQYIITHLMPRGHYEVRVLARTKQGWPSVGDSFFNWTSVVMPSDDTKQNLLTSLVNLNATNINASSINVRWKINMEETKQKINFDSWKLYLKNSAGKKIVTISLLKNDTEYVFRDLEADVSHGVELCMINSRESDLCLSKQLESRGSLNDYVVTNVEGSPVSSTSISLTWSPASNVFEHSYEICYRPVYSPDSERSTCLNTTDTTIAVRSLKPYTLYQFGVKVLNNISNEENLEGETIECYTEEDVPGAVRDVELFNGLSPTEVRVVWKQPYKFNGVIQNYTVFYMAAPLITASKNWPNVTVPGSKTKADLSRLAYDTLYFIEVRAATNAGYGNASERVIIRTGISPGKPPVLSPPPEPAADQKLGIIVGISISTCCIIICLSSIYCRKKWESTQSQRENSQTSKDRVILRNGNGYCIERNSVLNSQRIPATAATNELELAVLRPPSPSPKTTNSYDHKLNGIVEPCVKEPLLTPWHNNGDSRDLNITENPQYKSRNSLGSNHHPDQELDGTQLTLLNYTLASSDSSLNNNLENSHSLSSIEQVPSTSVPVIAPNG